MMTTYDYDYEQDELTRIQGEQMVSEQERTTLMKKELHEARNELDEQKKQAEIYKHLYDKLQSVDSEEEPNFQNEQRYSLVKCLGKWKDYRYNQIRESLFGNAVLLKEANAISLELRQQVAFQFILLTDCPYAHLPETLALGLDCETEESETTSLSAADSASLRKTIVAVEVSDARCGVTHIWSLEKLRQRMIAMQEMYEAFAKLETISPLIKACNLDDRGKDPINAGSGNNPFFDGNPWYILIGRSYIYLTHLLLPISLEQTVGIVTDRGNVVGHIDVLVELCEEDEETKDIKATTVAFEKSDSVWHPKDIPVYPYRQSDLIEQCYLSPDKFSEIIERPKLSSPPRLLGRSQSHNQKDVPPTRKKRMSRIQSTEPKQSSSDLVISPREVSDPSGYFTGENALRMTSSAREIRQLNEEDRFSVSEKGSCNSIHSAVVLMEHSLSYSLGNIRNGVTHIKEENEGATPIVPMQPKTSRHPLEHSNTLLTEPQSSSDYFSETSSYFEPNRISAPHLKIGKYIKMKVKVLRVKNLDKNCASVLLQNRFLYDNQEPYSSMLYSNDGQCCEVNHVHVFRIKVTPPFLDYIKNRGFMIEVFGHYEQHPLQFEDRCKSHTIPPVKSSAPSRSLLTVPYQNVSSAKPVARYDIIMNLQFCELNLQGDYIPVPVTHARETNGSFFLLKQGLQRRVVLSFVYDSNIELKMKKVKEVVVGRIRHQFEPSQEEEDSSLTLNVSSADFIDLSNDSRTVFRIQAAWDTSLHHTKLLNMNTATNMLVHATMSVYVEMENCTQPACFTINFSLQITNRLQKSGGSRFGNSIFPPRHRPENNCVVGLYEVALHRLTEANSRKRNTLMDNQSVYVRGEENLKGWQPRGISLIQEHQNQVKRLREIEQVERAKHVLSIREKVSTGKNEGLNSSEDELLTRCLYLWKFQISPFLQDKFTVEDPHSDMHGARSETPQCHYIPLVHDISHKKSNSVVKRGFIQLSEYEGHWRKFYAVLKRPYIYLYYNDKDPIERDFINLATAKLQFNQDQLGAQSGATVFSLCTKYRGFLCKTQDFDGWIHALDPLTSGAMVSKKVRIKNQQ